LVDVAINADDIILGGRIEGKMNEIKHKLSQKFKIKDLGRLHHFPGKKMIQWISGLVSHHTHKRFFKL